MLMTALKQLIKDDRGATAIEYGLIVAMLALGAMIGIKGFAGETMDMYNKVGSQVASVTP